MYRFRKYLRESWPELAALIIGGIVTIAICGCSNMPHVSVDVHGAPPDDMIEKVLIDPVEVPKAADPPAPIKTPELPPPEIFIDAPEFKLLEPSVPIATPFDPPVAAAPEPSDADKFFDAIHTGLGALLVSTAEADVKAKENPTKADETRKVYVFVYFAPGCVYCKPAKEKLLPELKALGYTIQIKDLEVDPSLTAEAVKAGITAYPSYWFVEAKDPITGQPGRTYKQVGGYTMQAMEKAIKAVPPPPKDQNAAVSARSIATVKIADALQFVRGKKLTLANGRVSFEIPETMAWTASVTDSSIVLKFNPAPHGYINLPFLPDWPMALKGAEITTRYVEVYITGMIDARLDFNWLCDQAGNASIESFVPPSQFSSENPSGLGVPIKPGIHDIFSGSGTENVPVPPSEPKPAKPGNQFKPGGYTPRSDVIVPTPTYQLDKPVGEMSHKEFRRARSLTKWSNPSFAELRASRNYIFGSFVRCIPIIGTIATLLL